jgi:hypothetical protein
MISSSSVEQFLRRRHEQIQYDERSGNRDAANWKRRVALTLAFAPMLAMGALPVTAMVGLGAQAVSHFTSIGIGEVFFAAIVLLAGAWLAKTAVSWPRRVRDEGVSRFFPHAITTLVVVAGVTEIVSGSKAPDPVLALWFFAFAWLFVFYPRSRQIWPPARRVLWAVGPIVTTAVIVVVWTAGFFAYRFDRSLDEFNAYVAEIDSGSRYHVGDRVGDFTIAGSGVLRGCEHAFRIEGWHESDNRWIAYCPDGDPGGEGVERLAGDWYEYSGR